MKHRTHDVGFFPCPICGRKPYVSYYLPNSGRAYCIGTVFRPHDMIEAFVLYETPSSLIRTLANAWNSGPFVNFDEEEGV